MGLMVTPTSGNTLDSTDGGIGGDYTGVQPTVTNPAGNTASTNVRADVGDNANGGYAGTTDVTTHILPAQISLDLLVDPLPAGPVPMDASPGTNVGIGVLSPAEVQTLQLVVDTSNIQGASITDDTWAVVISLSAHQKMRDSL